MSGTEYAAEARRWLRFAWEDLASARTLAAAYGAPPRQACWLAQQPAEKALKALLVLRQVDFPRTHDLDLLRSLLPDCSARSDAVDLSELTEWAVEARYPGNWPEITPVDAARAIATADRVLQMVVAEAPMCLGDPPATGGAPVDRVSDRAGQPQGTGDESSRPED